MSDQFKQTKEILAEEIFFLKKVFPDYTFNAGKLGSRMIDGKEIGPFWGSIFVENPEGISVGRLIYKDNIFSHDKAYGENKDFPIDDFFHIFRVWKKTGKIISNLNTVRNEAEEIRELRMQELREWREKNNSNKKRNKLEGPNVERILSMLIGTIYVTKSLEPLIKKLGDRPWIRY